jgi:hypothetical protein
MKKRQKEEKWNKRIIMKIKQTSESQSALFPSYYNNDDISNQMNEKPTCMRETTS